MNFNLGSMFRNTQQVTQAPQQQAQPAQANGQPGSSLEPNKQQPGQQQPGQPATQNSPLDGFNGLWDTKKDGGGQPADPFASPLFQTDPAKIREAASQIDFASQVPQELMQKAMSGQDPQAFVQVMNTMVQNALATALQLNTATTETAGQRLGERFNSAMPGRMKDFQLQNQKPKNPALTHPNAAPLLKSVREQVKTQNPDMSAEQINEIAENFLGSFADSLKASDPAAKPAASDDGEMNWLEWASPSQSR